MLSRNYELVQYGRRRWPLHVRCCKKVHVRYLISWWVLVCGCQWMARVPNAVEIVPKISTAWVGRSSVRDRQTERRRTDGRATAYSEPIDWALLFLTSRARVTDLWSQNEHGLQATKLNKLSQRLVELWQCNTTAFEWKDAAFEFPHFVR